MIYTKMILIIFIFHDMFTFGPGPAPWPRLFTFGPGPAPRPPSPKLRGIPAGFLFSGKWTFCFFEIVFYVFSRKSEFGAGFFTNLPSFPPLQSNPLQFLGITRDH